MATNLNFAVRGTALNARSGLSGNNAYSWTPNGPTAPLTLSTTGFTGEIGASSINVNVANGNGRIGWPGYNNIASPSQWIANPGISVLSRVAFPITNTGNWGIFCLGPWGLSGPGNVILFLTGGQLEIIQAGFNTTNGVVFNAPASLSINTFYDIVWTWDGTTGANAFKLYINNVLFAQMASSQAWATIAQPWPAISMGGVGGVGSGTYVNEFVIWNGVINPASVLLDSGLGALSGNTRTSPVTCSVFDGSVYTDPGIAQVTNGTAYTFAGVAKTGTFTCPTSTDPGQNNVLNGVGYIISGVSKTGTVVLPGVGVVQSGVAFGANSGLTGTLLSTDPGIANVLNGVSYQINSVAKVGNVVLPGVGVVEIGTAFGSLSALIGTYTGGDRWTDPGIGNVSAGVVYLANAVSLTGTRQTVTNEIKQATLVGQSRNAILMGDT